MSGWICNFTVGSLEARENSRECALAAAVSSNEPHAILAVNGEVDAREHAARAIGLPNIACGDDRHGREPRRSALAWLEPKTGVHRREDPKGDESVRLFSTECEFLLYPPSSILEDVPGAALEERHWPRNNTAMRR
jgi:hypothetical protein